MTGSVSKSRILIIDSHRVVIAGIKSLLKTHWEFQVVGETTDGSRALKLAKSLAPHMVILDIATAHVNGIEMTMQIREAGPEIKVIVFTSYTNKQFIIPLFRAGISAYVLKEDPLEDLILALKALRGEGTYFSTMAPATLMKHVRELEQRNQNRGIFGNLSAREHEIFCLLADGRSVKEIADKLRISPKTVESHKYNIMDKLQAQNMASLTKIAIKRNLIEI